MAEESKEERVVVSHENSMISNIDGADSGLGRVTTTSMQQQQPLTADDIINGLDSDEPSTIQEYPLDLTNTTTTDLERQAVL